MSSGREILEDSLISTVERIGRRVLRSKEGVQALFTHRPYPESSTKVNDEPDTSPMRLILIGFAKPIKATAPSESRI